MAATRGDGVALVTLALVPLAVYALLWRDAGWLHDMPDLAVNSVLILIGLVAVGLVAVTVVRREAAPAVGASALFAVAFVALPHQPGFDFGMDPRWYGGRFLAEQSWIALGAAAAALAFARAASDWRSPASWGAWTLGTFPAYGLLVTVFEIVFQDMEPFRAYPSPIPSIVVALAFVVISYAPLRVSPR